MTSKKENGMPTQMMSTREVARFLGVNEKMVYSLVSEKGLPATKITGKWIFPRNLVEQWIENNTRNYPRSQTNGLPAEGLLVFAGSNDLLLDRAISLYNERFPDHLIAFANIGSMGGLRALRRNICHIASCHLMHDNEKEYNFDFAREEMAHMPVVINFCRREQGILLRKDNPKSIKSIADIGKPGIRVVNRSLQTGTRRLFDSELKKAGLKGADIEGYNHCVNRHLDVGLEILAGKADAGPAIRSVAELLDLDFLPLRWERYDLLVAKEHFFEPMIQAFLGLLHENDFKKIAEDFGGYDIRLSSRMVFPDKTAT